MKFLFLSLVEEAEMWVLKIMKSSGALLKAQAYQ